MTLKQYLRQNSIKQMEFARLFDISQQTVSRTCRGKPPRWDTSATIVTITNKQVTYDDIFGEQPLDSHGARTVEVEDK